MLTARDARKIIRSNHVTRHIDIYASSFLSLSELVLSSYCKDVLTQFIEYLETPAKVVRNVILLYYARLRENVDENCERVDLKLNCLFNVEKRGRCESESIDFSCCCFKTTVFLAIKNITVSKDL